MDKCNDKITVKDYIFTKHHAQRKILKYILCRVVDPSKKVPDLKCEVQDLLLEVVDLKQEVPDLRSGGIPHNLIPVGMYELLLLLLLHLFNGLFSRTTWVSRYPKRNQSGCK